MDMIGSPSNLIQMPNNHFRNDPQGDRTSWEYHTVSVTRVPGYGFGIAVSGGRDNPHFANGDPSIAVSDVLKGGPAEDRLQVNDRIISVNGVSLENVEYATAVQVLRDSGNTVTLVVKRRVPNQNVPTAHQHSHSLSSVGLTGGPTINTSGTGVGPPVSPPSTTPPQPIKVVLTKASKKEDFGIVLGCRLFIKEISTKARDQLTANGYSLQEGDIITRIHNTNCSDTMSIKEAKKIIDGCKERLNLVVLRDITNQPTSGSNNLNNSGVQSNIYSHTQQVSGCSNNLDDPYLGGTSYSSQNLYVQPPTRGSAVPALGDEKSNLTPRGRSRGPLMDVSLSQLDRPSTPPVTTPRRPDEPPRPPPPRGEDFYTSRRQLYEDDPLQRSRQSAEPRFISFQKEGSVGIRLTGGNEAGIFVTAVQPGSPASLQGLTPGDKILKVNDMDMHGVTREEAVLFLLSLQDRIDLIVQHCKEEYEEVVANQRGDSFHIKTHFHCENPSKGEMAFKAGDVFRVIDTLHNGVVGSWQVLKIGRGHQEMQRGVIPNKSRAEELATAQFNATKKEMNASESRGNFFRRRRSTHRRSKSLSRENWDDVVFSDSISKFPAYERVVLRHPGFVRPVVLFGPVSDIAREQLTKDFPDKFTAPLQDDDKSNSKCKIVRLSNIRDIMDRGKHALLDITPNAVDRLNYAQFYPIVIFLKTDSKHVIKQLRQGIPKSAHKSSKKLLEQCQKLERVWSHIFSTTIILNETDSWYRKLREAIDLQQSGAVWMSESKHPYEHSNPTHNRRPTMDNKYGYPPGSQTQTNTTDISTARPQSIYGMNAPDLPPRIDRTSKPPGGHPISSPIVGNTPRNSGSGGTIGRSAQERLFGKQTVEEGQDEYVSRNNTDSIERTQNSLDRQRPNIIGSPAKSGALPTTQNGSYDSVSSYDSYNTTQLSVQNIRLGPNAPDDLKSVPTANGRPPPPAVGASNPDYRGIHDHHSRAFTGANDLNRQNSPGRPPYHDINSSRNIEPRSIPNPGLNIPQRPSNLGIENSPRKQIVETKTDYGKYSRNNSASQADYSKVPKSPHVAPLPGSNGNMSNSNGGAPFKPVPPPKPKNYRPPMQGQMNWESGEPSSPRSPNGFFYPPTPSHYHHSQAAPGSPHNANTAGSQQNAHAYGHFGSGQQPPYPPSNGYNGNHPYGGQYVHRGPPPPIGNLPHHASERHGLDLAGSREQRGSAFELYRKPQVGTAGHHHNVSDMEPYERYYYQSPHRSMIYANEVNEHNYQHFYARREITPPPLPPVKTKKKSVLKSPLVALKNAFMKSTRPLRRMNSMVEPERKIKPCLRRQHSMTERSTSRVHYHPDEYSLQPIPIAMQRRNIRHEPFYPQDMMNSTYQNLEADDIYGSCKRDNQHPHAFEDLYANRALIDLERRQAESRAGGRRIIRRHSMADRTNSNRPMYVQSSSYPPEDIYQSRQGSYLLEPRRPPGSAVMVRRRFHHEYSEEPIYHSRREMHRSHLYQSRREMQERIAQGKKEIEREFSPQSSSQSAEERDDRSDRDSIYQSRREVKESGLKTRTQLREQIYQTRRDAMESMAEPIYVSKREVVKHEPIYESREECGASFKENETDERKEEKSENSHEETLTNSKHSDLQRSNETVIDTTVIAAKPADSEEPEVSSSSTDVPATPRSLRTPFHISNIIKRTAPPVPTHTINSSRTSIETHYTSQASLPVGPPNATSTPYASDMALPMAATGAIAKTGPNFPPMPREPSTTKGIFDETGGTLCDNLWNVSLHIPPGAIPPGVKQEIYFTVSDPRMSETVGGPPLDMENGETMLSPLVMCGPQGLEFLVPVTLNIPHCAGRTASLGLALKATDSEKNLQTNWDNIDLPSNTAAHTVSVKVDHF